VAFMQVDQIEPRVYELDTVSTAIRQLHSKVGMPFLSWSPCNRGSADTTRTHIMLPYLSSAVLVLCTGGPN
jgi:hypothetical protein